MTVIDVHTHMLTLNWIELLKQHGGVYDVKPTRARAEFDLEGRRPFMTLFPGMWDYDLRIKAMDKAKVDVAIISLTCPNCSSATAHELGSRADRQRLDGRAGESAPGPHPVDGVDPVAVSR